MNLLDSPVTLLTVIATVVVSWRAFQDPSLMRRLLFSTEPILAAKEYYRLITSGLVHAHWPHLLFNMFSYFIFARSIEAVFGVVTLLVIYVSAIVGGGLLSLFIHRHHHYQAVGASGGVCGVIFAHIFLFKGGGSIMIMPIPVPIPSWLYAILFLVGSYVQLQKQSDNIGHDAHLGGAVIGLLVTTAMFPRIVVDTPWLYLAVMGISVALFVHLLRSPLHLPGLFRFGARPRVRSRPRRDAHPRYTTDHMKEPKEVDRILEKIAKHGIHTLTDDERALLQKHSKRLRGREG